MKVNGKKKISTSDDKILIKKEVGNMLQAMQFVIEKCCKIKTLVAAACFIYYN